MSGAVPGHELRRICYTAVVIPDDRYVCLLWSLVSESPLIATPLGEITHYHVPILTYLSGLN